jgi:hypothetical protein
MKTVKSALLGNKQLIDTNADVLLLQLKEIIKEHRSVIITRLMKDLSTYLDYKFQVKVTAELLVKAKERLLEIRSGHVDLECYNSILQLLMSRAVVHLTNEPFYDEIDKAMASIVLREKEIV